MNILTQHEKHNIGFVAVAPQNARAIWPSIEHHASAALKHSTDGMTTKQILEWIVQDRLILVVITRNNKIAASATMEMAANLNGKSCHIITMGGDDMDDWLEQFIEVWEKVAIEQGADYLTMKGRKGWQRATKPFGFEHEYTQMKKDLRELH